jgi:hypothetical protein
MATARSEYENTRDHFIGVMTEREDRKMKALAVAPNATIWLTEEEEIATANAPRSDADNPFINGDLKLLTPSKMVANRRPTGDTTKAQVPVPEAPVPPSAEEPAPDAGDAGDAAPSGGEGEGGSAAPTEEPKAPASPPEVDPEEGRRERTPKEAEENARAAAGRRRAPAPAETTANAVKDAGAAAEGSRPAAEVVATPEAQKAPAKTE